jgi:hypothetical protein
MFLFESIADSLLIQLQSRNISCRSRMSYISLLVGQCGNQLGSASLEEIAGNCAADSTRYHPNNEMLQFSLHSQFFSGIPLWSDRCGVSTCTSRTCFPLPTARAVLVDSEPRVVSRAVRDSPSAGFRYRSDVYLCRWHVQVFDCRHQPCFWLLTRSQQACCSAASSNVWWLRQQLGKR